MINGDLILGASCGFGILFVIFVLYATVFSKIMPDHKEEDGTPYFPYD